MEIAFEYLEFSFQIKPIEIPKKILTAVGLEPTPFLTGA